MDIRPENPQTQNQALQTTQTRPHKVLRYVKNERMGGSVPVWETPKTTKQNIEQNLATAQNAENLSFKNTLAYNANQNASQTNSEEFGFGDLVDMINPLQHIPVVGHVYREITGDEIKPIGKIIGGGIFGGPLGAASGLVDTIVENETGKDMAGNTLALMLDGEKPHLKSKPATPEAHLDQVAKELEHGNPIQDLPGELLSFTDLKGDSGIVIKRIEAAEGRTTGYMETTTRKPDIDRSSALPPREPITQVRLKGLYAL
ncbi:MAG: hypothetical protein KDI46_02190 [Alphaproteobacteria bacterium]|nr:hypothetical protein [Alphaproteobacteria bacterium]